MKTVQELYNEIKASEELKAQVIEAAKAGKLEAFLKEHGCDATRKDMLAFVKEKSNGDTPLSLDELENAAGGECNPRTTQEICLSIFGFFGVTCVGKAIESAAYGYVSQQKEGDGRMCNRDDQE